MFEPSGSVQTDWVHAGGVLCLLRGGDAVREMAQNGEEEPLEAEGA